MSFNRLANPNAVVNNLTIEILPNSLEYNDGFGEGTQTALSTGGGGKKTVFGRNLEEAKGMIKFSVINTIDMLENIRQWQINDNENVVSIADDGFSRTMTHAAITNNPDVSIGADAEIELVFHGDALV